MTSRERLCSSDRASMTLWFSNSKARVTIGEAQPRRRRQEVDEIKRAVTEGEEVHYKEPKMKLMPFLIVAPHSIYGCGGYMTAEGHGTQTSHLRRIHMRSILSSGRQLARRFALFAVLLSIGVSARASDQVLDWIAIMNNTILSATPPTSPLVTSRQVALVSAAVFDAVNGIQPHYEPLLVAPDAAKPASRRAAAVEAAYGVLANLYPAQAGTLAANRDKSIAALTGFESTSAIKNGIDWGDKVATAIIAIRSTDGFNPPAPPFEGVLAISQGSAGIVLPPSAAIGNWRPTPTGSVGNAPGAAPQFASMTPWVLTRPSQFRLPPPYASANTPDATNPKALTTADYAADYNEVKTMGVLDDATHTSGRTADRSQLALFWAGNTALFWNRIASDLSIQRHLTLTQNARLFALLNVTMADAAIACWDGKYRYVFWRPITAIRSGDLDNNPATDLDSTW